ncbi:hypothetical protein ACHAQA_006158 [Verticillium albo-atrum]
MAEIEKCDLAEHPKTGNLGNVRLRHENTNEIILVPTPSDDPNDPLNWSLAYRRYIAGLVVMAMFLSTFLAAGPSTAIVQTAIDFFGTEDMSLSGGIAKVAYFFSTTALLQGMGNLVWMPLIVKYGRRPAYIASFTLYFATIAWVASTHSYASALAGRAVLGFASGAAESLGPLTISDVFYLHERGTIMSLFSCALAAGVSTGIVIGGLITINLHWRYIYWVSMPFVGACTLLIIFTFPETSYIRAASPAQSDAKMVGRADDGLDPKGDVEVMQSEDVTRRNPSNQPSKAGYLQSLRIFSGKYTEESFWRLAIRPVVLLPLPPVLWATLVMATTIGFLVAITSNFAPAFHETYHFEPYQSGLCFISSTLGAIIGIFFGGHLSDMIADYFTKRNGGIREAEMRLPALCIPTITGPLGLILYGCGIDNSWHWMVPTLGLGLLSFSIVQATNVTLVYTVDSYRPVAGEVIVSQFAFKSAFGFLLSFYTNPWVHDLGYTASYGTMAGISGAVLILWVPFYIFGSRLKRWSWNWSLVASLAHWSEDREVGE